METRVALKNIFSRPGSVFTELEGERKWVPAAIFMVLLLGLHAFVVQIGTYSESHVGSLIDTQSPVAFSKLDSPGSNSSAGRRENGQTDLRTNAESTSLDVDTTQIGSFIVWTFILVMLLPVVFAGLCIICFFDAVYFRLVGVSLKLEFKLKDWFALSVWSRVPGVALSVVAVTVGLVVLGRQPDSDELEVLSLTRWVDLPEVYHTGDSWNIGANFDHIDAYLIWTILLQTIGFQRWSGKSPIFSLAVVLIPTFFLIAAGVLFISST